MFETIPRLRGWGGEHNLEDPELEQVPVLAPEGSRPRHLGKPGSLWASLGPNTYCNLLFYLNAILWLTLFLQHCEVGIICQFSRLENGGTEKLSDLSEITQLVSGRAGIQMHICLKLNHGFFAPITNYLQNIRGDKFVG